jgi:hypothetical protein
MKHSLEKNRKRTTPISPPKEEEWGNYSSDLDQKHAHSVFAGRTNEDMQPLFRRNPLAMTDDLRWMPDVPFRYYILGFRDFITANQFDFLDGADAASCFLGLVLEKLKANLSSLFRQCLSCCLPWSMSHEIRPTLNADENIYGNFLEKLSRIQTLYAPYAALNR